MHILTNENISYSMNNIPNEVDDILFCVLDYTDPKNADYIFIPLMFLESFNKSSIELRIGKYRVQMPSDWSIIMGDKNTGALEVLELTKINGRDFQTFVLNPISGYMPEFLDIEIMNIYPDMRWHIPKLKYGHILSVPLCAGNNPPCAFFVKDINKIPESLDITHLV